MEIGTDAVIADRVWKGLKKHLGARLRQRLFHAHLSGHPDVETLVLRRIADAIENHRTPEAAADVSACVQIDQLSQKVRREAHRMKGFVRFQHTGDDHYLALIAPCYDVLPLIRRHFESRYADQDWIIYDTTRNYGIGYHREATREIRLDNAALSTAEDEAGERERLCQTLWQRYYAAVNIRSRDYPAQHHRQLPRRYWRYLTEKKMTREAP